MDENNKYYAMLGSERRGPMSLDELCRCGIAPNTPVWHPGMADWADASTLPELASYFAAPRAPYQPYGQQPPYQSYNQPYGQPQQPPYQPGNGQMPPCPNNYLVWSIIVLVCCCLVGGIVALVYSSKVQTRYNQGDYNGALQASNNAKNWCIASAIIGFVGSAIYGVCIAAGALADL